MDEPATTIAQPSQVERIIQKLGAYRFVNDRQQDPEVAPLFPGYNFDMRLVSGITPIDRNGPLDAFIDRPRGMRGWIINLTIRGKGTVFDGKSSWNVEPGDLVLFPTGSIHYYGRHPEAESWWHRWIYFQPRSFWMTWLSWQDKRNGIFVLKQCDTDLLGELDRLFSEISGWAAHPDLLSMELAVNLLERIILLCGKQNQSSELGDAGFDERLLVACKYMTDNLHKQLTVEDVARHTCLSSSRLAHLFSERLGKSLMRWREEQRIQFAGHLLRLSNTPIKQIAAQVGFEDPLYFSRVFRKYTGISPKLFRERHHIG
jgi:AraC family transcriptional regulator, arabinose operon regulatory protein